MSQNSRVFCTFHIDAHHGLIIPNPCTTATFVSNTSVYTHFACVMVCSAQELLAIEKMAAQGMSIKKIAETVGGASENDKAVAALAALGR